MLVQTGQKDQARALIEQLAQSDDLPSQAFLAMWRMWEKKYDEAVQILGALESRFPDNPTPTFLKARVLLAAGKPREALEIAKKLRESPETAAAGSLVQILQELSEQNVEAASESVKELAEDAPSVSPGMNLLSGRLSAAKGDFATAVQQVSDSLNVTGLRQQARQTLLASLLQLMAKEGPQRAAEALAPLLVQYPEDAFLRVMEADLKFKQGQFDEGMSALNRAEQILGRKPTPVYLKAAIWTQAGQADRAIEEVKRCLSIDNEYLPAHVLAAQLYLATEKNQLAVSHATTALKRNPRHWELYLINAEALHRLGRSSDAMKLLQEAIKVEPRFLAAYRGLATLQLAASKPADALQTLRQARQALPESFVPITDEIAILCQQKQIEEAESLAAKSVGEPNEADKCLAISRTFAFSGHVENARQWAQKALDVAKDEGKAGPYRQLGELALAEGQKSGNRQSLETARDYFSKVVEIDPRDFIAGNDLAWLLATEFDQPEQALEVVRKVQGDATVEQMPIGFLDTLAVVYRRTGKLDEARELLNQALKSYPNNPVLMYHLGMILSDRGQKSAALNMLERAVDSGGLADAQKNEATKALEALSGKATAPPN
jgi:tetratricopeptide (TPR) repeat protein